MPLKLGNKAPMFTLPDQNGEKVALKDFKGKKVVLYFYPKDLTPGCTTEACDFRDASAAFKRKSCVVLGISRDNVAMHLKFQEKHQLNFSLLADEDGKVCEKYGVWQEKKLYGKEYLGIVRTTFIIDEAGKIAKIFPKVKVAGHVELVLAEI